MVSTRLMRTQTSMLHHAKNRRAAPPAGWLHLFLQAASGRLPPSEIIYAGGSCGLCSSMSSSFQGRVEVSSVAKREEPSGSRYYQNPEAPLMFLLSHSRLLAAWNNLLSYGLEAWDQFGHLLVGFEQVPLELKREISHSLLSPEGLQPKCRQQESFHFHAVEICKFKVLCSLHFETSSWVIQKNISRLYYLWELVFVLRMSANVYMSISTITR